MTAPIISTLEAEQRDLASYLVDVRFSLVDPDGDDLTGVVEWGMSDSGPWNPANAQVVDNRHNAQNPLMGIPPSAPGAEFNYTWNAFFDLPEGTFSNLHVRLTVDDGTDQTSAVFGPFSASTTTPAPPESVVDAQLRRRALIAKTPRGFLGSGLVAPLERGPRDFRSKSDVPLVQASVSQVLGTRAAVGDQPGELRWRPDFGCKLWTLRHQKNDRTLRQRAEAYVREAFLWEPRVVISSVFAERSTTTETLNRLTVRVSYRVIVENVAGNLVFSPELTETVKID